jgi:hypothetical protein
MDPFGAQMLVGIALLILIVFPGTVSPAIKMKLDTMLGRLVAVGIVLLLTHFGGWMLGSLGAVAVLILLPASMREGFIGDKLQVIPTERRQRWFIEKVMHESPQEIETDGVETQAIN